MRHFTSRKGKQLPAVEKILACGSFLKEFAEGTLKLLMNRRAHAVQAFDWRLALHDWKCGRAQLLTLSSADQLGCHSVQEPCDDAQWDSDGSICQHWVRCTYGYGVGS